MAGGVPLDEVERTIDRQLPQGDYETLAGLSIAEHGALPPVGASVRIELPLDLADLGEAEDPTPQFLRLEVLEVVRHVPSRLRVELHDGVDTQEHTDGAAAEAAPTVEDER